MRGSGPYGGKFADGYQAITAPDTTSAQTADLPPRRALCIADHVSLAPQRPAGPSPLPSRFFGPPTCAIRRRSRETKQRLWKLQLLHDAHVQDLGPKAFRRARVGIHDLVLDGLEVDLDAIALGEAMREAVTQVA